MHCLAGGHSEKIRSVHVETKVPSRESTGIRDPIRSVLEGRAVLINAFMSAKALRYNQKILSSLTNPQAVPGVNR